jgi:hypothetical protein
MVAAIGSPGKWSQALGEAFLLGVVSMAVVVSVLGVAGVTLGLPELLAGVALWVAIVLVVTAGRLHRPAPVRLHWPTLPRLAWLFIGLTAINVVAATAHAVHMPVGAYDALVIWVPKADALARSHHFQALQQTVFPEYPPVWPVHMFFTRTIAPGFPVKVLPGAYLVSMLLIVFAYLEARIGPTAAAVTSWFISGIPYLWFYYGVFDLMADVPFMVFAVASTVALARYAERSERSDLVTSLLLAVGTALTRPEGVIHLFLVAAVLAVLSWRSRHRAVAGTVLLAAALTFASWQIIIRAVLHHPPTLSPDLRRLSGVVTADSVSVLVRYSLHEFSNPYVFGPTLIAVLLIVAGWRSWRGMLPVLLIFCADLLAITLVYLLLPSTNELPLQWWLVTGTKRMLLHFIPLLFIAAALAANEPVRSFWRARRDLLGTPLARPLALIERRTDRVTLGVLLIAISLACLATWRVAGPRDIALTQIAPSGLNNLLLPIASGGDLIVEAPAPDQEGIIYYDLANLGSNEKVSDSVFGRFTSLRANFSSSGSGRLEIATDGRVLARGPSNGSAEGQAIRTNVHLQRGARNLELILLPNNQNSGGPVAWHQPVLHRDGSGWVIVLLLLSAAVLAALAMILTRSPARKQTVLLLSEALPALFLTAAIVQQVDALTNVLLPVLDGRIVYHLPGWA